MGPGKLARARSTIAILDSDLRSLSLFPGSIQENRAHTHTHTQSTHTDRQTGGQTDTQTDIHTDRHTCRQTDRQRDTHTQLRRTAVTRVTYIHFMNFTETEINEENTGAIKQQTVKVRELFEAPSPDKKNTLV